MVKRTAQIAEAGVQSEGRPKKRRRTKQFSFNPGRHIYRFMIDKVPLILADTGDDSLVDERLMTICHPDAVVAGLKKSGHIKSIKIKLMADDPLRLVKQLRTFLRELPSSIDCHGIPEHASFQIVKKWMVSIRCAQPAPGLSGLGGPPQKLRYAPAFLSDMIDCNTWRCLMRVVTASESDQQRPCQIGCTSCNVGRVTLLPFS